MPGEHGAVTVRPPVPDAEEIRRRFDAVGGMTVGLEEEAMLLDPVTLDLAPVSDAVLERLGADPMFKREMPASQLEIVGTPAPGVEEAIDQLAQGRRRLAAAAAGIAVPATTGVHPFAAERGELSRGLRYDATHAAYGPVAERQLVASLQVHVAIGGAERTLAVYNALRGYLPELTALAANAPFHGGRDTGLATVRPLIAAQLPRQGVPPALASWESFAEELRWGQAAGALRDAGGWWWELRPHVVHGTLELRVPDVQTKLSEAAAVTVFAHGLAARLAEAWDAGELRDAAPEWRIEENRFAALRHGLDGELADLSTGRRRPTRERLADLVDWIEPVAGQLGGARHLPALRTLVAENGAIRQRRVAAERGLRGLAGWLGEQYLQPK
jgi:carboxylate-amine ligase